MTTSVFPGAIDNDTNLIRVVEGDSAIPADHNNLVDAVEAIEGAIQPWVNPAAGAAGQVLTRTGTAPYAVWGSAGAGSVIQVIEAITLSAAAASFDFTSIPGDFNHLWLRILGRVDTGAFGNGPEMQLNADTGNNYSSCVTNSNGSSVGSGGSPNYHQISLGYVTVPGDTTDYATVIDVEIPFYSSTALFKVGYMRSACLHGTGTAAMDWWTGGFAHLSAGAVSEIKVFNDSGNWIAGSQAFLYGIG